jgi:hypothetical protein
MVDHTDIFIYSPHPSQHGTRLVCLAVSELGEIG